MHGKKIGGRFFANKVVTVLMVASLFLELSVVQSHGTDTYTVVKFKRKLLSSDTSNDRNIASNGTVNVIWAYYDSDPSSVAGMVGHESTYRGSSSIDLFSPSRRHLQTQQKGARALSSSCFDSYTYSSVLDSEYSMYWNINDTMIDVAVIAKTSGWVGWGISSDGTMAGADIVVGWYDDEGTSYVYDSLGSNYDVEEDTSNGGSDDLVGGDAFEIDDDECDDSDDEDTSAATTFFSGFMTTQSLMLLPIISLALQLQ